MDCGLRPICRNPTIQKQNVYKPDKTRSDSSIYKRGLTTGFLKNRFPILVSIFHCPQNNKKMVFTCTISGHAYYVKKDISIVRLLLMASLYWMPAISVTVPVLTFYISNLIYFSKQPCNLHIRTSFYTREKWLARGPIARAEVEFKPKSVLLCTPLFQSSSEPDSMVRL